MENTTLTREQLYELVWSTPMIQIAKKFNISDNDLRKICTRMEIPLPDLGHWQKIQHGKSVRIKKLPVNYTGLNEAKLTLRSDENIEISLFEKLKLDIETNYKMFLIVPKKLTNPDPLIVQTLEYFNKRNDSKISYERIMNLRENSLSIRVGDKHQNRALLIMDTFIKLIRARGHNISIQYGRTTLEMYTVTEHIFIIEKHKVIKPTEGYNSRELGPTGKLIFKPDGYLSKEWTDTNVTLEEKLSTIVAWFEKRSIELKNSWDKSREEDRIRKEKIQKEKELLELKKEELNKFKGLLNAAERLQQSQNIRNYISIIEQNVGAQNSELMNWISWANDKADWYDPLINLEDPLLGPFKPEFIE